MTTVLAAIDAQPSAREVLGTAIAIAPLFQATPAAVHVRENGAATVRSLASTAGVELHELHGTPIDQIVAATKHTDVAALVLGARGVSEGPRPAGHTALEVITRVAKPVVVVPPDTRPPERLARILVPLEGSAESSRALADTIALAHARQLEILVLHVHSAATVPAFADHEPHATSAWDEEFLRRHLTSPHERVRLLRRVGAPAEDIGAVAEETSCQLVVLAWSQRLGAGRARVVSQTLERSSVPVLLLPTRRVRDQDRSRLRRSPHPASAPDPDAPLPRAGLDTRRR
jgi:nucleotide-binding universal stress UspA family protein